MTQRYLVTPYTLLGRTRYRIVDILTPDIEAKAGVNDFATQEEADAVCQRRNAQKH